MAWQVPLSSSGMIDLGETDSVFVGRTVQLSSNLEYAVRGIGSNHQALIHGTVAGASSGIILGDFPSVDINNQLTVEAGGQIFGFGFSALRC